MAWATYSSYKRPYTKRNWRYSSAWKAASPYRSRRYGSKARALGNSYSARQQADSTQVVINKVTEIPVQFSAGTTVAGTSVNIWSELYLSSFYPNYAPMYDQVKLDGVRVKINGSVQGNNVSSYITPTVITAWDRNGISPDIQPHNISTYSSAVSKPWSLGNAFVQYRDIYAKTMSEKSQYVSTQSLSANQNDPNNPASPYQVQAIPWKPQLLIEVDVPTGSTLGGNTVVFNVELDFICTFRGLRKGAQSGEGGSIALPVVVDKIIYNNTVISLSSFSTAAGGAISVGSNNSIVVITGDTTAVVYSGTPSYTATAGVRYYILQGTTTEANPVYFGTSAGSRLPGIADVTDSSIQVGSIYVLPNGWTFYFGLN